MRSSQSDQNVASGTRDSSLGQRPSSSHGIPPGGSNSAQAFSPTNTNQLSNFFNSRGPIRPQNLFQTQDPQSNQNQIPQARDFIRLDPNQQQQHLMQMEDDDYYGEEEGDGGDQTARQSARGSRVLSPEDERAILMRLAQNGRGNPEFQKVMNILQNDLELRPLIFEHEILLGALTGMQGLKAEYMLSILTAAETEMYENQRQKEENKEKEVLLRENNVLSKEREELLTKTQTANFEIDRLKRLILTLEQEKLNLTNELGKEKESRETLEKEKECTFKNLFDENQMLKKMNETLKKAETEQKKLLQDREREFKDELEELKNQVKEKEVLKLSMLQDRSRLDSDLRKNERLLDNLQREIQLLEKENENLHRKMNSTLNSILFQSHLNHYAHRDHHLIAGGENTPARRNLSSSFQNSGLLDNKNTSQLIGQPAFAYGHSTQKLKMLMSENNKSSFIAHSIYYGQGYNNQQNNFFQRGDSLVRSNSIDVILLDDEESKRQNTYHIGEEEKQTLTTQQEGLANKLSLLNKTKGILSELSPINSISSQQMDHSTYRNEQQKLKALQVEEENNEILGTQPNGKVSTTSPHLQARYYEQQVKKLQLEVERLKEDNNQLTQKLNYTTMQLGQPLRTDESLLRSPEQQHNYNQGAIFMQNQQQNVFATPSNNNGGSSGFMANYQRIGLENTAGEQAERHRQIIMTNNINPMYSNEQSPMLMATFSQEKERKFGLYQNQYQSQQSSVPKQQYQSENLSEKERQLLEKAEQMEMNFMNRVKEIGERLFNLLKKLNPSHKEVEQYCQPNFEFSMNSVKDLIFDITQKIEQFLQFQQSSFHGRVASFNSQGPPQMYPMGFTGQPYGQPFNYNPQLGHPQTQPFMFGGSHINSNTTDISPPPQGNFNFQYFEEKERRLQVHEELLKTRENVMKFQVENEQLKKELYLERNHNQTQVMSGFDYQHQNIDTLQQKIKELQDHLSRSKDENITLKLQIGDLESDLADERSLKARNFDSNIDIYRNNLTQQLFEQKLQYEEKAMQLKEQIHGLNRDLAALVERNRILNESLKQTCERKIELEKENLNQHKENYELANELEYEQLKGSQVKFEKDKTKKEIKDLMIKERMKYEDSLNSLQKKCKQLQDLVVDWEFKANRALKNEKSTQLKLSEEIKRLQGDNEKLIEGLKSSKSMFSNATLNQEMQQNQQMHRDKRQKLSVVKIALMLQSRELKKKFRAFMKLLWIKLSSQLNLQQQPKIFINNESAISFNMLNENSLQKIGQLEQQLLHWQEQTSQIITELGKVLRSVNSNRSIKLNLTNLISKQNLDRILYGFKNNSKVTELNLSNCQLDDEDLEKIERVMSMDQSVDTLKLSKNIFIQVQPLINLIISKRNLLKELDISNANIDQNSIIQLTTALSQLEKIQKLALCGVISRSVFLYENGEDQVNKLLLTILSLKTLRALDLSKNKLAPENFQTLFLNVRQCQKLDAIVLNSCGITDQISQDMVFMISSQKGLRKLNLSGNKLSSQVLDQILKTLIQNNKIEDLDLSKCHFNNDISTYKTLALLISSVKSLRVLHLQQIQLNDANAYYLIQPLVESLNLEVLKLDSNEIGPTFIEKLCKTMLQQNGLPADFNFPNQNRHSGSLANLSTNSFGVSDNESSFVMINELGGVQPSRRDARNGLTQLSLQNNNIGDRGAIALGEIIKTPIENFKFMQKLNLNECNIGQEGYAALSQACEQRGTITRISNLSHIRITIIGNPCN